MRDYVLTLFIFSLVPVCILRPWIGVLVWYWFGLMNPHRLTWDFAQTMPYAMYIGGATLLGTLLAKDRRPIPWNRELLLMAVLMSDFTITTFFAWAPEYAWPQWEKVFKVILMTLVATMFIYGKDRIRALLLTVAFSVGFWGVKGVQFALLSGGSMIKGPERTFLDGNNFFGLALNMVIPLLVCLGRDEQKPWLRRTLYATAALTVFAIPFTYSRGSYLGLVAILPLIFLRAKRKVVAASILIPVVLLAPLVLPEKVFNRADQIENYQEDSSANMRLATWTLAWRLGKDHPLMGAGFEFEMSENLSRWYQYLDPRYAYLFLEGRQSVAHSVYFQILGQHGFVGLSLMMIMLIGALLSLQKTKNRAERTADTQWIATYASGLQVGLIAYMVNGAFINVAYVDLMWIYVAVSALLVRELKSAVTRTESSPSSRPVEAWPLRGANS